MSRESSSGRRPYVFDSHPLPPELEACKNKFAAEHKREPFNPVNARDAVRRAASITGEMGIEIITYRGGLALQGVEVDHVWLACIDREEKIVVDLAFPMFDKDFVANLRGWVAGDLQWPSLVSASLGTGIESRVVGVIPPNVRYVGEPVWR